MRAFEPKAAGALFVAVIIEVRFERRHLTTDATDLQPCSC